ncbi:RNA-binding protein 12B-like [Mixophyes fleayi]|uniref:RNA-binding protein 12B-like n=1 Tax=Mixophyes fleayi TaxID=3061075 RepID=UPI003F4DBACD
MGLLVRIEGLPDDVGSNDILNFFSGLEVAPGGLYIVGGELGEAYIEFACVEHAYCALARAGGLIKDSPIKLSRSCESYLQTSRLKKRKASRKRAKILRAGLRSLPATMNGSIYVIIQGFEFGTTEDELRSFFGDLHVVDIIFHQFSNVSCGNAIVKFGTAEHAAAAAAMGFYSQYICNRRVTVRLASEFHWFEAAGWMKDGGKSKEGARSRSPHHHQYYIHLQNLPFNITKEVVKKFICHPEMADTQITFLLDKQGVRTREAFVMLISMQQQQQACLQLHQRTFSQRSISVFPISVEKMQQLLEAHRKEMPTKVENSQYKTSLKKTTKGLSSKRCIYLRNFPADVTKFNIQQFFSGFNVDQEDIVLLYGNNGDGMGEALVKFSTEHAAVLAESLHRQRFLGTEILLLRISEGQMKGFNVSPKAYTAGD